MLSGNRWRWAIAGVFALCIAILLIATGFYLYESHWPLGWQLLPLAGSIVSLGSAGLGVILWAGKRERPIRTPIDTAKERLADAVAKEWIDKGRYQDWMKWPIIQVRWRAPADPAVPSQPGAVSNPPLRASSADTADLAKKFRASKPGRLVILGGPGTGKTTLAIGLLQALLDHERRGEHDPVPVFLLIAQWNVNRHPTLQEWVADQLYQNYPGLRSIGAGGIRELVDRGDVLPVLDGLDELDESSQATTVERLNRSLGRDDQLILTSRTAEYAVAARKSVSGRGLDAAAVLEPRPVSRQAAAAYLRESLQTHQRIEPDWIRTLRFLRIRPRSALAQVTRTPLGLWLIRAVYIEGKNENPAELTDPAVFPEPGELRKRLLDDLIEAVLPHDDDEAEKLGLSRAYRADDIKRWLGFLARHLSDQPSPHDPDRRGIRDLEWWRLAATTGKVVSARKAGFVAGVATLLVAGFAAWYYNGPTRGFGDLLLFASMFGLVFGIVLGLLVGLRTRGLTKEPPGYAEFRPSKGPERFRQKLLGALRAGRTVGFVFGLAFGLVNGFGAWFSAGFELLTGLANGLIAGLVAGLVTMFANGLFGWVETPSPAARAVTPHESLKADRNLILTRFIVSCIAAELGFGIALWLGNMLAEVSTNVIVLEPGRLFTGGLILAPIVGVSGVAFGRHRAWLGYVWATWRLSREGHLPRKLMPFLDDMYRLGLLRTVGRIYQFRHAELQDRLAETYEAGVR